MSKLKYQRLLILYVIFIVGMGLFVDRCNCLPRQESKTDKEKALEEITKWKAYKNEEYGFEIKYPENLIRVSEEGKKIVMIHSIPFEHPNFCDGTGEAPPLKEVTDFRVSFKIFRTNLTEAVIATQGDYVTSNFLEEDRLKIVPHFIDEFEIGSLKGYRITSGAEGCGWRQHYFPLNSNNTLLVTRYFFPELTPAITDHQEYSPELFRPTGKKNCSTKSFPLFGF